MADDALSRMRNHRNGILAEIKGLEAVLARQAAGSPVIELTRQVIVILKKQAVEVETFLSAHGGIDALGT
jgi:hypothetical protein